MSTVNPVEKNQKNNPTHGSFKILNTQDVLNQGNETIKTIMFWKKGKEKNIRK